MCLEHGECEGAEKEWEWEEERLGLDHASLTSLPKESDLWLKGQKATDGI